MYSWPNFICQNTFLVCAREKTAETELNRGGGQWGRGVWTPSFPIVFVLSKPLEVADIHSESSENNPLDLLVFLLTNTGPPFSEILDPPLKNHQIHSTKQRTITGMITNTTKLSMPVQYLFCLAKQLFEDTLHIKHYT